MYAQYAINVTFVFKHHTLKSTTKRVKSLGTLKKKEITASKLREGPVLQRKMVKGIKHRAMPLLKA